MGLYLYSNPVTGEIKEIFQSIHDEHKYSENGIEFQRVFTVPNASIDGRINPFSQQEFLDKTRSKRGSLGDVMDASRELSEKREKILGKDPLKEKYYEKWSKKRRGKDHPDLKKKKVRENLKSKGIILE